MTLMETTEKDNSTVLSEFFKYLEKVGLEYCVIGRTEDLPEKIVGDVDLVINTDSSKVLYRHISDFCSQKSLKVVQVFNHEPFAYYYTLTWNDSFGKPIYLHLDICSHNIWKGRMFLNSAEMLSLRTPALDAAGNRKGFFVAAPAKEFIYYLIKKADKQILEKEHTKHLSAIWAKAPEECDEQLKRFWPEDWSSLLRKAAIDGDWEKVRKNLPTLQRSLLANFPGSAEPRAREIYRRFKRVLQPTGLHVAFLGPDGSGKSSVIDRVIPDLTLAFRKTACLHLRPGLGRKWNEIPPVIDPHGKAPRNLPESIAKALYYWFDYFAGWWLMIWPKRIRSTLVVFDRYYHDLLVDPKRYRYGGPMWLVRLVGGLIPKPDLWILLDAPAEVLQERKQEVPIEETARQRDAYLKLVKNLKNGFVVDASQNLDDVVGDVNAIIFDIMARRMEKRHAK